MHHSIVCNTSFFKSLQRRDSIKDEITATVDEHIRALEEKKRRLVENLDEIFQSKEKVSLMEVLRETFKFPDVIFEIYAMDRKGSSSIHFMMRFINTCIRVPARLYQTSLSIYMYILCYVILIHYSRCFERY